MVTLGFVSAALLDEMIFMEPHGQGGGRGNERGGKGERWAGPFAHTR